MSETDTDAADRFDADVSARKLDESTPRLWQRYRRLPRNVVAIGFVSLLNDASSEIIYPLLPAFLAITLGASPRAIGVVEGLAESVSSLLKLFSGHFSDRLGRRKGLVVFGYGLASVVRPLLAFATSWYQVLAVRFTDRVGKGIRSAPRDAMIADAAAPGERGLAFGFHRAMDHAGAVTGPLIASLFLYVYPGDYRTLFALTIVPDIIVILVLLRVPATAGKPAAGSSPASPSDGHEKSSAPPRPGVREAW
ncbi:MAG TPA: MFS transporter, partial [Pyrinomonadaceae bacterium]|nr:MFS transporter [Pyrinomonadaceae bacterium]